MYFSGLYWAFVAIGKTQFELFSISQKSAKIANYQKKYCMKATKNSGYFFM